MKLIVHELKTSLYQQIKVKEDNLLLYAIRPHLYKHGNPAGTLKIQLQDSNSKVIANSETLNISAISAATYFHGYVRFLISSPLTNLVSYRAVLIPGGGYSFSESAYIGWCKDFDLRKVNALYSPNSGLNAALDLELWIRRSIDRGIS